MSNRGGKREGAGGKAGSIRPKFSVYWTIKDIEDYHKWLKKNYKKNPLLAKFVGEQLHGKAPQPLQGDDDNPIKHEHRVIYVPKRMAPTRPTGTSSTG